MKVSDRLPRGVLVILRGKVWSNQVVKFRTGAMDGKVAFEKNCHFRHGREKCLQKFLTFVEDEPDFRADNSLQVSYSQENQLDGLQVVSSACFEIQ
nr:AEL_HP1_G0031030.mRNA.1.CDS.1 [Saccharomyces cerevisiae]